MMEFQKNIQTKKVSRGVNTCEYIILHHTGGSMNFDNQTDYLSINKSQASCHYVVGQEGEIAKISSDKKITRHAGISKRDGKKNINRYSIGIEIVSDGTTYSHTQRKVVKELVLYLMAKHSIGKKKIIRHKDIAPDRKRDVGDNFRNNEYKSFEDYQNSLESMGFYESLFEKVFGDIKVNDRILKHPEAVADKLRGLSEDERNIELGFLIAFVAEKLKKEL